MLGKKLEVALKGKRDGPDYMNGKQEGEYEITLPDDTYFTGKMNHDITTNKEMNQNCKLSLTMEKRPNKNSPGSKIVFEQVVKDTNIKERIYDIASDLKYNGVDGKTLHGTSTLQRKKTGDKTFFKLTVRYLICSKEFK